MLAVHGFHLEKKLMGATITLLLSSEKRMESYLALPEGKQHLDGTTSGN